MRGDGEVATAFIPVTLGSPRNSKGIDWGVSWTSHGLDLGENDGGDLECQEEHPSRPFVFGWGRKRQHSSHSLTWRILLSPGTGPLSLKASLKIPKLS